MGISDSSRQMAETGRYNSYLVRVWWEKKGGSQKDTAVWRVEVESVQTSQKWQFSDLKALFNFIETRLDGEKPDQIGTHSRSLS